MDENGKKSILLVDDEDENRILYADFLKTFGGYNVCIAGEEKEALFIFNGKKKGFFDLLLSDINLPFSDGRDLARKIFEKDSGIKVLLMSGYSNLGGNVMGFYFIAKPFSIFDLLNNIKSILGQ
jgi:DNA-binding response OmpR family regulator